MREKEARKKKKRDHEYHELCGFWEEEAKETLFTTDAHRWTQICKRRGIPNHRLSTDEHSAAKPQPKPKKKWEPQMNADERG